jgi:hypothetical protein
MLIFRLTDFHLHFYPVHRVLIWIDVEWPPDFIIVMSFAANDGATEFFGWNKDSNPIGENIAGKPQSRVGEDALKYICPSFTQTSPFPWHPTLPYPICNVRSAHCSTLMIQPQPGAAVNAVLLALTPNFYLLFTYRLTGRIISDSFELSLRVSPQMRPRRGLKLPARKKRRYE